MAEGETETEEEAARVKILKRLFCHHRELAKGVRGDLVCARCGYTWFRFRP